MVHLRKCIWKMLRQWSGMVQDSLTEIKTKMLRQAQILVCYVGTLVSYTLFDSLAVKVYLLPLSSSLRSKMRLVLTVDFEKVNSSTSSSLTLSIVMAGPGVLSASIGFLQAYDDPELLAGISKAI